MSWMSEKKAKEILKLLMEAELKGPEGKAREYEQQLNDAGWKVTVLSTGTTVVRIPKEGKDGGVNDYLPRESGYSGFQGGNDNKGSTGKSILIFAGISVGVIGLIILIVYIAKQSKLKKNVGLQKG